MDEPNDTPPAENNPPADNRQPMARNQALIGVLVLALIVAVGLGLYFALRSNKSASGGNGGGGNGNKCQPVTADFFTPNGLARESRKLNVQIYWAGPKTGFNNEFRRSPNCRMYVRYLPANKNKGANGKNYEIIATYPDLAAINGTRAQANKAGAPVQNGPGGSIIYVSPSDPTSVFMAWPGVDYQVVVYDPKPAVARAIAGSGKVRPVRGG